MHDKPLATRIDTIFVPARDPEALASWYGRVFAMTEIFRSGGYIGLRFDNAGPRSTALTVIPENRAAGYVAFNIFSPAPEKLRAALIAEGCEVTEIHDQGAMRWFDFVDPAGNRVNVCSFEES